MPGEFEKELQEETTLTPDLSHDLLTSSESDHSPGGTPYSLPRLPSDPLNMSEFIQDFMGRNLGRSQLTAAGPDKTF